MDTQGFVITHLKKGDAIDFNLRAVPYDLMLSLIGALKWEQQKQTAALVAPDFRAERALQHERHVQNAQSKGENPKQIFMDFPVY